MPNEFLVIVDENGNILDSHTPDNISVAMDSAFQVQDVFFYSHGWWSTAETATEIYNRFSINFAREGLALAASVPSTSAFGLGIHWPSTISENLDSVANYADALSYFAMANRANSVGSNGGYALLRMLFASRQSNPSPLRIHLIGHSFGCKVVCMALEKLVEKGFFANGLPNNVTIDVVLLEAAFNNDELESKPAADYRSVINGIPGLRMLITTSSKDTALNTLYPAAEKIANFFAQTVPALGAQGPSTPTIALMGGALNVGVDQTFSFATAPAMSSQRLIVADLSNLHAFYDAEYEQEIGTVDFDLVGHHSDIYRTQIYDLLLAFLFQ